MAGADLFLVVGAVMIAAAGFVVGARTGARLVVRRALSAPAPEVRQAAVRLAAHTGLEPHLKALLQRTRVEQDRRVLATLGNAVSATVPGPDDPPVLDELRLWARSYADTGPPPPPPPKAARAERNLSWVLPVALGNVAAVVGAVVGAGVGGTALAVAGSALFAGAVLAAYVSRARVRGRSGGEATAWRGRDAPPGPVVAPSSRDEVIDLRSAGRGRSAADAFWDVTAPDDEVKELLEKREPGARTPTSRPRPARGEK